MFLPRKAEKGWTSVEAQSRQASSGNSLSSLLRAEGPAIRGRKRIAYIDTERSEDFFCAEIPERSGQTRSVHQQQEWRRNHGRI
jgi:hypothetical protein